MDEGGIYIDWFSVNNEVNDNIVEYCNYFGIGTSVSSNKNHIIRNSISLYLIFIIIEIT